MFICDIIGKNNKTKKGIMKTIKITKMKEIVFASVLMISSLLSSFVFLQGKAYAGTNQCSWTNAGNNSNWSNATNWSCSTGTVPTTGYDIIFPYNGFAVTSNNDLSATNVYTGMWFSGTIPNGMGAPSCTLYTITGNGIKVAGSGVNVNVASVASGRNCIVDIQASVTTTSSSTITTQNANNKVNLDLGNLSLGGALTISANAPDSEGTISVLGDLTGSSNITTSGGVYLGFGSGTTFTGNISNASGRLDLQNINKLSNSTTVTSLTSSTIAICDIVSTSVNFNLQSTAYSTLAKLIQNDCLGGGGTADEVYGYTYSSGAATYSGALTISSNVEFEFNRNITFSGNITGSGYTISYKSNPSLAGKIILSGSSNSASTPNGTYQPPIKTQTLSDSQPSKTVYAGYRSQVAINGTRGAITVDGGELRGTGTVGAVTSTGGTINPGLSPGVINTGNISYDSTTHQTIEIGGSSAGQYDNLNVTGTVSLGNAILDVSFYNGFAPELNQVYQIITNDGSDAITGTFNGLAEGSIITVGSVKFKISYVGGSGNDVTLKATYVPGPPGTGSALLRPNVILPVVVVIAGIGLFYLQRQYLGKKNNK